MPRRRCQRRLRSHEQGTTNETTPPLTYGLLDVGGARGVFATDVAADGAAAGRTIVQFVKCVAVVVPTAVEKVLNVVIDKLQHGHRLCKTLAPASVVVLAAAMTTSPVNERCQQRDRDQGNEVARNGTHQGLLPGGVVVVVGVVVVGIIVVVGGVRRRKDDARCAGVGVAAVAARGGHVASVVAHGGVVVLHVGRGRKAVGCCPRRRTPPRPGPVATARSSSSS
jgi:hypothetical protein